MLKRHLIPFLCLLALASTAHAQTTQVWQCSAPTGPVAPATTGSIVVSQTNPSTSSAGTCQLASATPSAWYTRATTNGGTSYAWATLASLGIGQGATSANVGTLTVAWSAPTANADGSTPVTPLASYDVYQGTNPTSLAKVANVLAPVTTYLTPPLPPGIYYFALTARGVDGTVSAQSSPAVSGTLTATIVPPAVPAAPTKITITCPVPTAVGTIICTATAQ